MTSQLGQEAPVARATARFVRVTPMKARRVVDLIRYLPTDEALALLRFAPQSASEPVAKVVASAVASFRGGRSVSGGIALGVATALKVYPICLLGWLAIRGQWRAVGAGTAAASPATTARSTSRRQGSMAHARRRMKRTSSASGTGDGR